MRLKSFVHPTGGPAFSLVLVGTLLAPSFAWAADPPPAAPTAEPATPSPVGSGAQGSSAMQEARRRYDRALELSDEGNYDEALLELQRAYSLAPTYRLLYNLGVVSVAVHDYVKAIDYFTRYLSEGGIDVEPARVTEVQHQIERLRSRVAQLRINANVPNAQISLDDVPVGRSPIETPLVLNSGRHRITASAPGYFPSTSIIELAGNDTRSVTITLLTVTSEKPSHPIPWLGWGITAVLGAGAAVTGILALNTGSSYDSKVDTLGVSSSDVSSTYDRMRALSITTDVLLVGTVVAAGVSFYLTIKPVKARQKTTGIRPTPSGFAF